MACKCCSLRISVSDVGTFVEALKASVCFKQFLYDNTSEGKIRVWLFGMVPLQQGEGRCMMNCIYAFEQDLLRVWNLFYEE